MNESVEVSVVLPCLNEEATVGACVRKAVESMKHSALQGEVLVVDNGSNDSSVEIAQKAGAVVICEPEKGYGNAVRRGFSEAKGRFLVMADCDDTYDLGNLEQFVEPLRSGYDLVIGSRLKGRILRGAMPWKNRYIGTPLLTGLVRLLLRVNVSDVNCGMRALTRSAVQKLQLKMPGMEFASEMIVKAAREGLRVKEIPITLYPDKRRGTPHLRPWRDGWRHLKLILILSPTHLYLIPGTFFLFVGLVLLTILAAGPLELSFLYLGPHWMIVGSLLTLLGAQILSLYIFVVTCSRREEPSTGFARLFAWLLRGENGFVTGLLLALSGFAVDVYVLWAWILADFGPVYHIHTAILGSTLIVFGIQTVFVAFFNDTLRDAMELH